VLHYFFTTVSNPGHFPSLGESRFWPSPARESSCRSWAMARPSAQPPLPSRVAARHRTWSNHGCHRRARPDPPITALCGPLHARSNYRSNVCPTRCRWRRSSACRSRVPRIEIRRFCKKAAVNQNRDPTTHLTQAGTWGRYCENIPRGNPSYPNLHPPSLVVDAEMRSAIHRQSKRFHAASLRASVCGDFEIAGEQQTNLPHLRAPQPWRSASRVSGNSLRLPQKHLTTQADRGHGFDLLL